MRSYNRLLVADFGGDKKLEMYVDITTVEEQLLPFRGSSGNYDASFELSVLRQSLYILSGNDVNNVELSLVLVGWAPMKEFVPAELVELRDIDRDGHLDVIQTKVCYQAPGDMSDGCSRCLATRRSRCFMM